MHINKNIKTIFVTRCKSADVVVTVATVVVVVVETGSVAVVVFVANIRV